MRQSISKTSAANLSSMSAAPTTLSSGSPTRAPRWWLIAGAVLLSITAVVTVGALASAAPQQVCGDAQSCQKACGAGDQAGCVQLGKLLADGKGAPKDAARAHGLFVAACQKGEAQGCLEAALDLIDGVGIAKSLPAAAALMAKSCELGAGMGCWMMGNLVLEGNGVPKNRAAALSAYHKSCDMGTPAGCSFAGRLYLEDKNVAKAIARSSKAAPAGTAWGACCSAIVTTMGMASAKT